MNAVFARRLVMSVGAYVLGICVISVASWVVGINSDSWVSNVVWMIAGVRLSRIAFAVWAWSKP